MIAIVNYENETGHEFNIDIRTDELCDMLLEKTSDMLGCEYECECNLFITDGEEIRVLNSVNRGIDKVTDVLSFPYIDFAAPCDYTCIDEEDITLFEPESGRLMLGDIVICYEKVLSQAEEYGHSVKRELSFLIVHSILHLFGYDHMTDDERAMMEDK